MGLQAVSHDLQFPTVECTGNSHVEVTHEDVRCHTIARFLSVLLHSPEQTLISGTVVAKGVEWTATPAIAPRMGQRKTEGGEGLDQSLHVARRCVESHPTSWATWRAHQRQLTV